MRILSVAVLICLTLACTKSSDKTEQRKEIPPAGMAGSNQAPDAGREQTLAEAQKNRRVLKGKVIEAIYKEGFAYVRLDIEKDDSVWVAIVNQKPTVGEYISVQEQAVLTDFHSKSLDRTFTKIVFGSIVN